MVADSSRGRNTPRRLERSLLYGVAAEQLEAFLAESRETYERPPSSYAEKEFRAFLVCGGTPLEIAEAVELAEKAVRLGRDDYWMHAVLCEVGAAKRDNAVVPVLSCYYASIPLAALAVIAVAGGLMFGMLAAGFIGVSSEVMQ